MCSTFLKLFSRNQLDTSKMDTPHYKNGVCQMQPAKAAHPAPEAITATATDPGHTSTVTPFTVVELFTSQGCSSCPPADGALSKLLTTHPDVIPLSFHVDYWNYLGWPDPFSEQQHSARQRQYAAKFNSSRVYTPQAIVNGKSEGNGARVTKFLETRTTGVEITTLDVDSTSGQLTVRLTVAPLLPSLVANVALVQNGLVVKVARGENRGRTLSHDGVVRAFKSMPLPTAEVKVQLAVPQDVQLGAATSVVAYVQRSSDWQVVGAKRSAVG